MIVPDVTALRAVLSPVDLAALDSAIERSRGDEVASIALAAMVSADDSTRVALWAVYDAAWAWRRAQLVERARRAEEM